MEGRNPKMALFILPFVFAFFLSFYSAQASQFRLVSGLNIHNENSSLLIPEPWVSKAYYGELNGKPDYYRFALQGNRTQIYFGIAAPYVPGSSTDIRVEVYDYKDHSVTQVILLDGSSFKWKPSYEPLAGEWYLLGPEVRENLTNVTYYIKVSSPSNHTKYALLIGEEGSFPSQETLNAYMLLPTIKQQFFSRHVYFSFFQILGIILAMGSIFAGSLIILGTERLRLKSAAHSYMKIRYIAWLGFILTALTMFLELIQSPLNLLGMLRAGFFVLLLIFFLHANSRVARLENVENKVPGSLRLSMWISVILWIIFLFYTVAA